MKNYQKSLRKMCYLLIYKGIRKIANIKLKNTIIVIIVYNLFLSTANWIIPKSTLITGVAIKIISPKYI
jgi:hypothetical protein